MKRKDPLTVEQRRRTMSRVRSKDTSLEVRVRSALHAHGFRFRIHRKDLPGTPDIVFAQYRAIVLVHGCFWHRHAGCKHTTDPATRPEFWQRKFQATIERDNRVVDELFEKGWRIGVVWGCALQGGQEVDVAMTIGNWLKFGDRYIEIPEPIPNMASDER